jgi:putrescine transport system ATP-binding protein
LEDDLILDNAISQNGKKEKPFVQIRGLTKKFGAITAVDNIDLDIYQGSYSAFLVGLAVVNLRC